MSDSLRSQQFYVMQHARAQESIQRLQQRNKTLQQFVEMVAWGEWMEHPDEGCLFGDMIDRKLAVKVRDQARALVQAGQEAAA